MEESNHFDNTNNNNAVITATINVIKEEYSEFIFEVSALIQSTKRGEMELITVRHKTNRQAVALLKRNDPNIKAAWRGFVIVDGKEFPTYGGVTYLENALRLVLFAVRHLIQTGQLQLVPPP